MGRTIDIDERIKEKLDEIWGRYWKTKQVTRSIGRFSKRMSNTKRLDFENDKKQFERYAIMKAMNKSNAEIARELGIHSVYFNTWLRNFVNSRTESDVKKEFEEIFKIRNEERK